ncbi:MAG: AAA family ATPase [bacterium]|nr:AAA family ATPase [bacterium]
MQNIIRHPVRDKNFYPRTTLVEEISGHLREGKELYVVGPKRSGKTSLLEYFARNPQTDFRCIYVTTEAVSNSEEYFETLLNELPKTSSAELSSKKPESRPGDLKIPRTLQKDIIDFLISIPTISDSMGRQAFLRTGVLDTRLYNQLNLSGPPMQFVQLLVPALYQYGTLEDGRHALIAVLEAARDYVGLDKREYCNELIRKLDSVLHGEGQQPQAASYFATFKRFMTAPQSTKVRFIILVDDFTRVVETIRDEKGVKAAKNFLQQNHELRRQPQRRAQFLFAGSENLAGVAQALDADESVQNLTVIKVLPLDRKEAWKFTRQLLNSGQMEYKDSVIDHLLNKTLWFMPFYIQLVVYELFDNARTTAGKVDVALVERAVSDITGKDGNLYFEDYYERLRWLFQEPEYSLAANILSELTQNNKLTAGQIEELAERFEAASPSGVLQSLLDDQYIRPVSEEEYTAYQFTSPILRRWWKGYVQPGSYLFDYAYNLRKKTVLRYVEIQDVDFFDNCFWVFQPGINVLLGRNGYGKSHLLRLLTALLQNDPQKPPLEYFRNAGAEAFATLAVDRNRVSEIITFTNEEFDTSIGKVPLLAIPDSRYISQANTTFKPPSSAPHAAKEDYARNFLYQEPYENIILKFLYQLCFDYGSRGESRRAEIISLIEQVIERLTESEFEFAGVDTFASAEFGLNVLTEGNSTALPIQKASQGVLSVVAMFGLIYNFLKYHDKKSSTADQKKVAEKSAIVFIDEVDAHLHPVWQQKILQLLRTTFPKVQFVVTAHSPLIVAGCLEGEVAVLRKTRNNKFGVYRFEHDFIGWDPEDIYRKIFEIEDTDESFRYYTALSPFKNELETEIKELEEKSPETPEEIDRLHNLRKQVYYAEKAEQKQQEYIEERRRLRKLKRR